MDKLVTISSYIRRPAKRKLIGYSYSLLGKEGVEIGGPSSIFSLRGYFPVYLFAKKIDGVNFSGQTVWEGTVKEGPTFRYYKNTGFQYIREASDLYGIASGKYDFVLSSHCLEHVANPLKALEEWNRVLKPGGILVLVLPDKRYTFDKDRAYTSMEHLLQDYRNGTTEKDATHFDEIVQAFIPGEISGDISKEELVALLKENYSLRRAHHHVFDFDLIRRMLEHLSFNIVYQQEAAPFHLITIAQKPVI